MTKIKRKKNKEKSLQNEIEMTGQIQKYTVAGGGGGAVSAACPLF